MIQEFYLVIHGETAAHEQGLLCGGGWDAPLNERGLRDARKLAKEIDKNATGIRVIFSSPLLRCIQMTDVLHDQLKVKVRVISGLSERGLGQWEKKPIDEIKAFSPLVDQIPGGENLNRFRARVQESLNYILDSTSSTKANALLVTHELYAQTLTGLIGIGDQTLARSQLYRFFRVNLQTPWQVEKSSD
jgi:broad specificity phosphatase PhoE